MIPLLNMKILEDLSLSCERNTYATNDSYNLRNLNPDLLRQGANGFDVPEYATIVLIKTLSRVKFELEIPDSIAKYNYLHEFNLSPFPSKRYVIYNLLAEYFRLRQKHGDLSWGE